ncbi:hypothetical protein ACJJTC_019204 [Scirpophaga incertulas]
MRQLAKEISELRNNTIQSPVSNDIDADHLSVCSAISGALYNDVASNNVLFTNNIQKDSQFTFDIETKLKEPSVPKASEKIIEMLNIVQRFGTSSWSEVRVISKKYSNDLLQLVCGHRSETVEVRRDAILKNVTDPTIKVILNKILPSNSHIFDAESFSAASEKAGVRKVFVL